MKAEVAVATVQGKTYFLMVNQLKERSIHFISLVPGETVPTEIKVVITTEKEKHRISHEKILVYDVETEPDAIVNEVRKILPDHLTHRNPSDHNQNSSYYQQSGSPGSEPEGTESS